MTSDVVAAPGRISVARHLRGRRERIGLTQRELAGLAECSLASVANMEHGYVPRTSSVLTRVERVLSACEEARGASA